MKDSMPRFLWIVGKRYQISVRHGTDQLFPGAPKGGLGATNADMQWIAVRSRSGQGPDSARDTLLHEVLHALTAEYGLRSGLSTEREERIVRLLAVGLLDVLRRNPSFARFLLARDEPRKDDEPE